MYVKVSHGDVGMKNVTIPCCLFAVDNVEMEIVLPGKMTVEESHDIALALQHKIESLPDVERAFVHVDHQKRDGLEHKVERELVRASTGPSSPEHTLFQGNKLPASYSSNA